MSYFYTVTDRFNATVLSFYHLRWNARALWLNAAVLAQSVERLTTEREEREPVAGSIPGTRPILRVLK